MNCWVEQGPVSKLSLFPGESLVVRGNHEEFMHGIGERLILAAIGDEIAALKIPGELGSPGFAWCLATAFPWASAHGSKISFHPRAEDLRGMDLRRYPDTLEGRSLRGLDLSRCDLSESSLIDADLTSATLDQVKWGFDVPVTTLELGHLIQHPFHMVDGQNVIYGTEKLASAMWWDAAGFVPDFYATSEERIESWEAIKEAQP